MEMHLERTVPEILMLGLAMLLLVLDLLLPRGTRKILGVIAIAGTAVTGISLSLLGKGPALAGLFLVDDVAIFFKWLFVVTAVFIFYMAMSYEERIKAWKGEFYTLIAFAVLAMMLLASCSDLISFYVSLEFMAICLYVLAAFAKDERRSVEAGLKYLITGALASGFLLYGMSFLYGATGTTSFAGMADALRGEADVGAYLLVGLAFTIMGLTFKISSLPFHVWAPDVYQGSPAPVTALLAAGSKAAGFVVMLRILLTALGPVKAEWAAFVALLSGLTMIFGNMAAMPQKDIKRLIAYAGIGSAGYLLMGVAAASTLGAGAIMFYLLAYLFGIVGAFLVIIIFSNAEGTDSIEAYAGLSRRSPLLAGTLFIALLSLVGVPPLAGFIAKFYLIAAAVKEGLIVLAIVGLVMAIVTMYYFLLVIKSVYLREPTSDEPIRLDPVTRAVLYTVNVATLFLGIYPGPVTDWVMLIAGELF